MKNIITLITLALLATSCSTQNDPTDKISEDAKNISLTSEEHKRVEQDNAFAFNLLKQTIATNPDETNVFVSPLSVSIALGMAWNGASGETKTEMESALKMNDLSTDVINSYYKIMQSTLPGIDPTTKLSIANSIWYKKGFAVKPNFLKTNTCYFNTYVKELDFSQTWAKDTINNWCAKHTKNLIPTILDAIPKEAMMYITNAVYFKGIWRNKFERKATSEDIFTNEQNKLSKVNMMYQKNTFGYAVDNQAQYLDLPYGNKAFSMTIILPDKDKTPTDLLGTLTNENWNNTLNNLSEQEVMVYLPRFKLQNKFQLKQTLQTMGIKQAFTEMADFTKIADGGLAISEVVHKTYVAVDEDGTEAAAVTNIGIYTTSIPCCPVVSINRPFLFIIREKSTGVILFIGKMGNVEKY